MTEYRLKVLHFSDLHERGLREREPWRRRRVLGEAWKRNLEDIVSEGPVDLVCVTGDVADWGLASEYGPVTDFVEALLERLSLPVERLFVVPGNHDIQRKTAKAAWGALRRKLPSVPALAVSRWMAGGEVPLGLTASHRDQILERSGAYRAWLESIGLAHLLPKSSAHGRLGYRKPMPAASIRDLPFGVHVIGLDSAWMCGGNDDSGKLLLTEDQVARLATEKGDSLGGFRLALVHHPLSDLADGGPCRDLLAQHVDLLLRGHLHREELAEWVSPGQRLRQIAAGSLYEGDQANHWPNACHVITITLDAAGRPKQYDVRLRGFSNRGEGFWLDDNGLYREGNRSPIASENESSDGEHQDEGLSSTDTSGPPSKDLEPGVGHDRAIHVRPLSIFLTRSRCR